MTVLAILVVDHGQVVDETSSIYLLLEIPIFGSPIGSIRHIAQTKLFDDICFPQLLFIAS